jgi:hypothetical protein
MSLPRRSRQRIPLLTPYALALGVAVVLWGTSYKLEQYPQQGLAFRVMPPAKLLTEKERPVRKQCLDAVLASFLRKRTPAKSLPAWNSLSPSPRNSHPLAELLVAVFRVAPSAPEFTCILSRPPPKNFPS